MLLAIEQGNTNTLFAVHDGQTWIAQWRAATHASRTADEYAVWLSQLLTMASLAGIEGKKVMVIAGAHLPEKPALDLCQFYFQLFGGFGNPNMMSSHRSQTLSIAIDGSARHMNTATIMNR